MLPGMKHVKGSHGAKGNNCAWGSTYNSRLISDLLVYKLSVKTAAGYTN